MLFAIVDYSSSLYDTSSYNSCYIICLLHTFVIPLLSGAYFEPVD